MRGMEMMFKSMGIDMVQVEKVVGSVQAIAAALDAMQKRMAAIEAKQDRLLALMEGDNGGSLAKCG